MTTSVNFSAENCMINLKKQNVAYSPSDLRKMPFRPTKSSHPTYGKCPSDLQILPIRPTKRVVGQTCPSDRFIVGRMHQYAIFKVPIRPTVHRTYRSCKNHMLVGRMGSRTDGRWSKNTPSSIYKFGLSVCLSVCLFVSNKRQNG